MKKTESSIVDGTAAIDQKKREEQQKIYDTEYEKYKSEVDRAISLLTGENGILEAIRYWIELLEKASFLDPTKCTLTKAEKEALLTVLGPLMTGAEHDYSSLTTILSHVPFIEKLDKLKNSFLNSDTVNALEKAGFLGIENVVSFLLGFSYNSKQDAYYTKEGSIQNQWGFSDAMDDIGPVLGMELDTNITTFVYDGQEFRVQLWKGTYGYGGCVGGEFGLYSRPEWEAQNYPYQTGKESSKNILYDCVEQEFQLPVKQTVSYRGPNGREKSFTNDTSKYGDGDHYWNLNIRSEAGVKKSSISSHYEIDCSGKGEGFCDAMYNSLKQQADLSVTRDGDRIIVDYK